MTEESPLPIKLGIKREEAGLRLDKLIQRRIPGLSRGSVRRLLEQKKIMVDGQRGSKGLRLRVGQEVLIPAAARSERPVPQPDFKLDVVAVTEKLIAINKPDGIHCHPLIPGELDTLANAIAARFPECVKASSQAREAGLVHRLDWSTSGLVLAARSANAYGWLRGMFSSGLVHKHYLALVHGEVLEAAQIQSALRTMPGDRTRMQVIFPDDAKEGRRAKTNFKPLQQLGPYTLVEAGCRTAQRHQVRAHLAHAGHPLVGDEKYGGRLEQGIKGAFLHASQITLAGEDYRFSVPLPKHREALLHRLRGEYRS